MPPPPPPSFGRYLLMEVIWKDGKVDKTLGAPAGQDLPPAPSQRCAACQADATSSLRLCGCQLTHENPHHKLHAGLACNPYSPQRRLHPACDSESSRSRSACHISASNRTCIAIYPVSGAWATGNGSIGMSTANRQAGHALIGYVIVGAPAPLHIWQVGLSSAGQSRYDIVGGPPDSYW